MKRYRMQSIKLWVEGAYVSDEAAIKGLSDQLLEAHPLKYPQMCRGVVLKVKIKSNWEVLNNLKIFPFKQNHITLNEFKYETIQN